MRSQSEKRRRPVEYATIFGGMTELDLSLRRSDDTPPEPFEPLSPEVIERAQAKARSGGPALLFAELAVAFAWIYYGLWCKLFHGCATEDAMLAALPGRWFSYADDWRFGVGGVQVLLAVWVLSRATPRLCALVQAIVVVGLVAATFALAPARLFDPGRLVVENVAFLGLIFLVAGRRAG